MVWVMVWVMVVWVLLWVWVQWVLVLLWVWVQWVWVMVMVVLQWVWVQWARSGTSRVLTAACSAPRRRRKSSSSSRAQQQQSLLLLREEDAGPASTETGMGVVAVAPAPPAAAAPGGCGCACCVRRAQAAAGRGGGGTRSRAPVEETSESRDPPKGVGGAEPGRPRHSLARGQQISDGGVSVEGKSRSADAARVWELEPGPPGSRGTQTSAARPGAAGPLRSAGLQVMSAVRLQSRQRSWTLRPG
ncbi:unnamed protein product [Lampetra fluviatilis]